MSTTGIFFCHTELPLYICANLFSLERGLRRANSSCPKEEPDSGTIPWVSRREIPLKQIMSENTVRTAVNPQQIPWDLADILTFQKIFKKFALSSPAE